MYYRREPSLLPVLITELPTLVGQKSKQTLFTLLLPVLHFNHLPYLGNKVALRRFHKHKTQCQNRSLFLNHQRKDLSISIFFVVESYIFHMALYRLFFVRSTHSCINWPKIWIPKYDIRLFVELWVHYKKTTTSVLTCCVLLFCHFQFNEQSVVILCPV